MPQTNSSNNSRIQFKNILELGDLKDYQAFDCTPKNIVEERDRKTYTELNEFIMTDARETAISNLYQTFALVRDDVILGYCSIYSDSVVLGGKYRRSKNVRVVSGRSTSYPAISIQFFCINNKVQGKSFGSLLMYYMLEMVHQLSFLVGITLMQVHALESAKGFYLKQGFEPYGEHKQQKNIEALAMTVREISEILD